MVTFSTVLLLIAVFVFIAAWIYFNSVLEEVYMSEDKKHRVRHDTTWCTGLSCGTCYINHRLADIQRVSRSRAKGRSKLSMYYETSKRSSVQSNKPHFLLLHPTGFSCKCFRRGRTNMVQSLIDRGYDVTLVDLRGHGDTSIPAEPYSIK